MILASTSTSTYEIVSVIAIIVGGLGAGGGALAFFRSRLGIATLDLQAKNIGAQGARIAELEAENARCRVIAEQQGERIKVLEDLATQASAVRALDLKVDRQHAEVLAAIGAAR